MQPEAISEARSGLRSSKSNKMSHCNLISGRRNLVRLAPLVVALVLCQLGTSLADQAISEVWSEGDGLRMKYSTNHNDLLSTKGSELSLGTDQREQQVAADSGKAAEQGAGGEGGVESGDGPSSSGAAAEGGVGGGGGADDDSASSTASDQQESSPAGGDQNEADSSSRRTEKIPLAGRVSSYSSDGPSASTRLRGPAPGDDQTMGAIPSPAGSQQRSSSSAAAGKMGARASFKPEDPELSFDSALEQSGGAGDPDTAAAADRGQDESAESAMADGRDHAAGLSAKFRAPSRAFKEAVRMGGGPSSKSSSSSSSGDGDSSSSSNDGDDNDNESNTTRSNSGNDDDDNNDESKSPASKSSNGDGADEPPTRPAKMEPRRPPAAQQQRQPMLDFARPNELASLDEDDDDDDSNSEFKRASGGPAGLAHFGPAMDADDYFRPAGQRPQQAHFHDHSGLMRAPMATAHKERQVPQQQQHSASPMGRQPAGGSYLAAGQQQQQPKQPDSHKQLAYFRGVSSAQSAGGPGRLHQHHQHQQHQSSRPDAYEQGERHISPDSVRDNFISPGHFPGSMPHLTQAASEIKAKNDAPAASTRAATIADSATEASEPKATTGSSEIARAPAAAGGQEAKESSQLVASDTNTVHFNELNGPPADLATTATITAASSAGQLQSAAAAAKVPEPQANEIIVAQVLVTPQPEVQFEGQDQIMAPILASTTTMAPALSSSTSAAPSVGGTSSSSSPSHEPTNRPQNGTTTPAASSAGTSQAPSLKRFKFRKYR